MDGSSEELWLGFVGFWAI